MKTLHRPFLREDKALAKTERLAGLSWSLEPETRPVRVCDTGWEPETGPVWVWETPGDTPGDTVLGAGDRR